MKICLINNLYHPYNRGGADRITELITNSFKNKGHDVFVISTKPYHKSQITNYKSQTYYINSLYFNLNKIPIFIRLFWHIYDIFNVFNYFKIKKILIKDLSAENAGKPDLVITNNLKGLGYLIPKAIKSLDIKHIHILHDIQLIHPSGLMFYGQEEKINGSLVKLYSWICANLFSSPNVVVSPSQWLMDMHKNFFKNSKKIILPNPAIVDSDDDFKKQEDGKFKFIYIGELEEHKGILLLIEAFNKIQKKYNNSKLIIIGTGSLQSRLDKQNNNIELLGWQENYKVKKIMRLSDCLIMPSLCYENSPTVIYEAAAANLPVIASHIGGIPELINYFGGKTFQPGNSEDLIRQMEWMLKNKSEAKKHAQRAKEKIKEFSTDNYINTIEKLI